MTDAILIHAVCADRMCDDCGRDLDKIQAALRKAEAQVKNATFIWHQMGLLGQQYRKAEAQRDAWDERAAMEFREKERQRRRAEVLAVALRDSNAFLKATRGVLSEKNTANIDGLVSSNERALAGEPEQVCEHDWRPQTVFSEWCAKCGAVAEPEREAPECPCGGVYACIACGSQLVDEPEREGAERGNS